MSEKSDQLIKEYPVLKSISEARKGKPCPYRQITCQEGLCSCCEVYEEVVKHPK